LHCGSSADLLWDIIKSIDEPITFWLDAHYVETPILQELVAIKSHHIKTHTILIDDVRLFGGNGDWGRNISIDTVIQYGLAINNQYNISYEPNFCGPKDILVFKI